MDIGMTDEQEQLADAERAWLSRHDPIAKVRQALDHAPIRIDDDAVAHAEESGLLDLLTTEVGGTHMDLAVCAEAHGYAGSSLPIADLAVARWVLERVGVESDALTGVAQAAETTTRPAPMAADMAQFVVVRDESVAVVTNPVLAELTTLDLTRSWARLTLDAPEWRPAPPGTSERVRAALALHRGFDAIGAAARLLEMTVEYAGQREQFGAPIGSFQAVKHHCADMAVGVEAGPRDAVGGRRVARRRRRAVFAPGLGRGRLRQERRERSGGHRAAGARRHRIHLGARSAPVPAPHPRR